MAGWQLPWSANPHSEQKDRDTAQPTELSWNSQGPSVAAALVRRASWTPGGLFGERQHGDRDMEMMTGADQRRKKQFLERTRLGLSSLETNKKDGFDLATWTIWNLCKDRRLGRDWGRKREGWDVWRKAEPAGQIFRNPALQWRCLLTGGEPVRKAPNHDVQDQQSRWVDRLRGGVCLAVKLTAPSYMTSGQTPGWYQWHVCLKIFL